MKKFIVVILLLVLTSCVQVDDYNGYANLIKEYEEAYINSNIGYGYAPFGKKIDLYQPNYQVPLSKVTPLIKEYQRIDKKWDSIYAKALKTQDIRLPNKEEITFKLLLFKSRMKLANQKDMAE